MEMLGSAREHKSSGDKRAILKWHRKLIRKLQEQIDVSRGECDRLEKELGEFDTGLTPINKLPPELLSMVFDHYLIENPRLIRRLLLVNRSWYDFAITSPHLWTRISIHFLRPNYLDVGNTVISIVPYVQACLRYGGTLPLDIAIDLNWLHPRTEIIRHKITTCLTDLFTQAASEIIDEWLERQNWAELEARARAPIGHPMHAFELIELLTGKRGEHMRRWNRLSLVLPKRSEEFGRSVWNLFQWPMPNIKHLQILDMASHAPSPRFDLPYVTRLELDDCENFHTFVLSPSELATLRITTCLTDVSQLQISKYHNLYELHLLYDDSLAPSFPQPPSVWRLDLPRLHTLKVLQGWPSFILKGDLPNLELLVICRTGPHPPAGLPIMDRVPPHVRCTLGWLQVTLTADQYDANKAVLKAAFREYQEARTMSMPIYMQAAAQEVVEELENEHVALGFRLVFEGGNDDFHEGFHDLPY